MTKPTGQNEVRIKLTPVQWIVHRSRARFRSWAAGRRSGKTYLGVTECLNTCRSGPKKKAAYFAPTYRQAKDIAWEEAKAITRPYWARAPFETELRIELYWGSTIILRGCESYDRHRGQGLDLAVVDEYGDIAEQAWTQVIRPSLADRLGRALFIGTPKGFNHFYDQHQSARDGVEGWAAFDFTTLEGGLVPAQEVESARRDLDPAVFRQEFEASFEDLTSGRVYYAWPESNIKRVLVQPEKPLILCCDFNRNPMSWVIAQEHEDGLGRTVVHVIDELVLPDTDTPVALDAFGDWIKAHLPRQLVRVKYYGDASGHSLSTGGAPSDWATIERWFGLMPGLEGSSRVDRSNPFVRDRVQAVNRMLADIDGSGHNQRLIVDPRCKELIEDLRRVVWQVDAHGNQIPKIDKSDSKRTHTSDALGYYLYKEFRPTIVPTLGRKAVW